MSSRRQLGLRLRWSPVSVLFCTGPAGIGAWQALSAIDKPPRIDGLLALPLGLALLCVVVRRSVDASRLLRMAELWNP